MKFSLVTVTLAVLLSSSDAFSVQRRNVFSALGSAGLLIAAESASATSAKTGQASPFTGDYDDPNHPNCLRQVKVVGAPLRGDGSRPANPIIEVTGYDGKSGEKMCTDRPTRSDLWKVQGTVNRNNLEAVIDFSPKGGPSNLKATFDNGDKSIVFPDGNRWTKVVGGTRNRLPEDMSTLKSS
jgi:hypothetical protein